MTVERKKQNYQWKKTLAFVEFVFFLKEITICFTIKVPYWSVYVQKIVNFTYEATLLGHCFPSFSLMRRRFQS